MITIIEVTLINNLCTFSLMFFSMCSSLARTPPLITGLSCCFLLVAYLRLKLYGLNVFLYSVDEDVYLAGGSLPLLGNIYIVLNLCQ